MKVSEKVVFTLGDIKVVREQGYGFRSNSLGGAVKNNVGANS